MHDFRWFKIVNKETPTIEFTFESGAEFVYDGTGEAPNIGATVLEEGVEFNTYFEKDEVNIGTSIPTEPGTYSFIVETVENDQYVSARGFRWFIIKSPTLLEPTITFGETVKFPYDGNPHTPTYSVEPAGLHYTIPFLTEAKIEYTSHDVFYSYEAPTKPGWYALVVTIPETAYYQETSSFAVFCIQDTKEHFISEWNLAMSKGVCDYATNSGDMANYEYLLEVYRDCMTNEVRDEVSNYQWSENSTILETMQYIEMLRSSYISQEASQAGSLIHFVQDTNALVMMLIMGFGLALVGGYYLLNKKRAQ